MFRVNAKSVNLIVSIVLFMSAIGICTQPSHRVETIYDFEGPLVLDQLTQTPGVRISLTSDHITRGEQALQIKVPPFDETKDQYPRVHMSTNIFITPADYSSFSRVSMDVTNVGQGLVKLLFGMSNLPHFDVRGQLQGVGTFILPPGVSTTVNLDTASFPRLDVSRIQAMMIRIMTSPMEQIIVVDNIRAEYDSRAGSPLDTLQKDIAQLKIQYAAIEQNLDLSALSSSDRREIKQTQETALEEIDQIARICDQIVTGRIKGQFKELREKADILGREIGRFVLMDKPAFYSWWICPYLNIFPEELPSFNNPSLDKIELTVSGGEYRDAVFMITANTENDQRVSISLNAENPQMERVVRINEVLYLENRLGERTGDAHCLLEGPLQIPAGQSRQLRLGFDNRNALLPPGVHNFRLTLRDIETQFVQHIPGVLNVLDFQLPNHDILPNNCFSELPQTPFREHQDLLVRDMSASGFNIFYVHPLDIPRIKSFDPETGSIQFDAQRFENMMALIMKHWKSDGRPKFLFSISAFTRIDRPEDLFAKVRNQGAPLFPDSQWQTAFKQWVVFFRDKMQQLGFDYADWMITPADESSEYALRTVDIPIAELIKDVDSNIRLICNSSNTSIFADAALTKRYFEAFDIFQPDLEYGVRINPDVLTERKKSGNSIWLYKCMADLGARSANIYNYYRLFTWDMMDLGAEGIGVWAYAEVNRRPQNDAWSSPNDGWALVFQNPEKPETLFYSRRYEVYREGIDDYRYIYALRQAAQKTGRKDVMEKAEDLIQTATIDLLENRFDFSRADQWRRKIAESIIDFSKKEQ